MADDRVDTRDALHAVITAVLREREECAALMEFWAADADRLAKHHARTGSDLDYAAASATAAAFQKAARLIRHRT